MADTDPFARDAVAPSRAVRRLDLILVMDCTGSMKWVSTILKANLSNIVVGFAEHRIKVNVGLMEFRDALVSKERDIAFNLHKWKNGKFLTDEVGEVADEVSKLKFKGGGDNGAESSLDGIWRAASHGGWTEGARRVLCVFTDDKPHEPDETIQSVRDLVGRISDMDIYAMGMFTRYQEPYEELVMARNTHGLLRVYWSNLEIAKEEGELKEQIDQFVEFTSESFDEHDITIEDSLNEEDGAENPFLSF
jgi:hypothetical protein